MRNLKGMEHFIDPEYAARTDHRFHALGGEMAPGWGEIGRQRSRDLAATGSKQPWWTMTDMAWVICLYRGGAIEREKAAALLKALAKLKEENSGVSGEERLAPLLGGDMDLASIVNYGRTLQEPMSRLKMRTKMLDVFDDVVHLLQSLDQLAMANLDAIMPGYTHMNHGQPMTLAHYLLAVIDGLFRGVELLEVAYRHVNRNSGGCGSCSGTTWPVDRELMAALLSLDGVVEPTYDCEAAQDHSLTALFALTNMSVLISQTAMNFSVWCMDEMDMLRVHPAWAGVSSFMPQKCDSGSNFERTRIKAADVMGETFKCVLQLKSEPFADVLPVMQLPERALQGMVHFRECLSWFTNMIENLLPQKERMLAIVRAGYSCATELATHLIQEQGYGGRLAHSMVATLVRDARVQGLKSYECTGEMLDQAAEFLGVRKPGLDTDTVRHCLDPEAFLRTHTHLGGTAPQETRRLLDIRRGWLDEVRARHEQRRERIRAGEAKLEQQIADICGGS